MTTAEERPIDFFARLKRRMPKPISKRRREALDEDREERSMSTLADDLRDDRFE